MRCVRPLLVVACVASAQNILFPDDRSSCDSSDVACIVGTYTHAAEFPVRINKPEELNLMSGETGTLNPQNEALFELPEGYVIDYSGGLEPPEAPYVEPTSYINTDGRTAFVGTTATIVVNNTHFTPERVSVLPGATVTWSLQTYETVIIRSEEDNGTAFNSGGINRNWSPTFSVTFTEPGIHPYRNAEVEAWRQTFHGLVVVEPYDCSSYISCTTCLAYTQCIWCDGENTCIERNPDTNFPLDAGVVVKIDDVVDREYQSIKYMQGYDMKTASMVIDWFPWPPIRRNPRPVPDHEVPDYYDPTSSDQCSAYMRTRDASTCVDYTSPGKLNRVSGAEVPGRPTLDDFFACYDHLRTNWAKPDVEPATPWTSWPPPAPPATRAPQGAVNERAAVKDLNNDARWWGDFCCDLCASCSAAVLAACNITACNEATAIPTGQFLGSTDEASCPVASDVSVAIRLGCAAHRRDASMCAPVVGVHPTPSAAECTRMLGNTTWMQGQHLEIAPLGSVSAAAAQDGRGHARRQMRARASHRGGEAMQMDGDILDTTYRPLGQPWAQESSESHFAGQRRRAQSFSDLFGGEEDTERTAWEQIPLQQRQFMPPITPGMDTWAQLNFELTKRFGPRCNATMGCDLLRGTCLNISGLPIIEYDQNGTCVCHPFYTGGDCSELVLDEVACARMPNRDACSRIREKLYFCGEVKDQDALPDICLERGLTVVQCGQAGHMRGHRNITGIPNLIGRPDAGYAALTCAKCMARGDVRSETYGKMCDPSVVLRACQRQEDATAQRLCNYCAGDTQGSALPQRGRDRSCSYYRGTCMGSVEKRIRGIVPPNLDIVGQTMFGGLRYCKKPTTFTSSQHYYSDEDIMQVGQTCLEGETPMYEAWDYSRQHTNPNVVGYSPNTVTDRHGMKCANPDDESTCPKARFCIDDSICPSDTPDFTSMSVLIERWGLVRLRRFADNPTCNSYTPEGSSEAEAGSISELSVNAILLPGIAPDAPLEECVFDRHKLVFDPQTAYLTANWPFMDQNYIDAFVKVDWSMQPRDAGLNSFTDE